MEKMNSKSKKKKKKEDKRRKMKIMIKKMALTGNRNRGTLNSRKFLRPAMMK